MNTKHLLLAAFAVGTLASCDKDDDLENVVEEVEETVLTDEELIQAHTWVLVAVQEEGEARVDADEDDCAADDTMEFQSDGTIVIDYNDDSSCDGEADEPVLTGTYVFDAETGALTYTYTSGDLEITTETEVISVSSTELQLGTDGDVEFYEPVGR